MISLKNIFPLLPFLILLVALMSGGCNLKHEPVVDGISKRPMAQATVERFLYSLKTGQYETAARCFAGPFELLYATAAVDTDPKAMATGNLPARLPETYLPSLDETARWLEIYVNRYPACVHDYSVGAEKMIEPYTFSVEVEFRVWGKESITELFQIGYDGERYWLLGLPPIFPNG